MKKSLLIIAVCTSVLLTNAIPAFSWGKREHAAIAYIAEQNLSNKARKGVAGILDGQTITSRASWLDYYKPLMLMKLTEPQKGKMTRTIPHTFQVDSSLRAYPYPEHSCITVIEESIAKLKNREHLDDSTKLQCLLNIVHLTGDMHCPGHVFYADKRDRNIGGFNVIYRGETVKYHKVWDSMVTGETFAGGIEDLAFLADTAGKKQVKEWNRGSLYDWGSEVAASSCGIWTVKAGDDLGNYYMYDYSDLALELIAKAGHRLAEVLNDIFK
ncbi:MAG: S1/P1 nuclease [Candidatus Cryptobacteroides sp.]